MGDGTLLDGNKLNIAGVVLAAGAICALQELLYVNGNPSNICIFYRTL